MGTSFFVSGSVIALRSSLLKGCMSYATAAAKSLQLCPTLCHPINSSPLGSPIPGILQAIILEWIAIAFSSMSYGPWPTPLLHLSYRGNGPGQGPFHYATRGTHMDEFSCVQGLERPTGHGGHCPLWQLALLCLASFI